MKKRLAVLTALLFLLTTAVLPYGITASAASYFPTTPIEYDGLYLALFSQLDLTTGTSDFFHGDNWKYYYRCSFTPQYSAEYTVTVSSRKKMKTELYDAQDNLLSASYAPAEINEDLRYIYSHTAYLEKGVTYYYEFAYTNGYYDSSGPFSVWMTSTPSDAVPNSDYLHLYVKGSKNAGVYELSSYSPQQLLQDLSLRVVYADGKLYEWIGKNSSIASLNGCDIILDLSDCAATVGAHTVTAHYMGHPVQAKFEIVNCIHEYEAHVQRPTWLEPGSTVYTCSKCSESITGDFVCSESERQADFFSAFGASKTDSAYDPVYDLNADGYINSRDYVEINTMINEAQSEMLAAFNKKAGSAQYDSLYDLNTDGIINSRDVVLLYAAKPVPEN